MWFENVYFWHNEQQLSYINNCCKYLRLVHLSLWFPVWGLCKLGAFLDVGGCIGRPLMEVAPNSHPQFVFWLFFCFCFLLGGFVLFCFVFRIILYSNDNRWCTVIACGIWTLEYFVYLLYAPAICSELLCCTSIKMWIWGHLIFMFIYSIFTNG